MDDFLNILKNLEAFEMAHIRKEYPDHSEINMYSNHVVQMNETDFYYDYDGFIGCVLRFNENGSVTAFFDIDPNDYDNAQCICYKTIDGWLDDEKESIRAH